MTTSSKVIASLNQYGLDLVSNVSTRISNEIEAKELLEQLFHALLKEGYTKEIIINSFQAVPQGSLFKNIAIAAQGELNECMYLRANNESIFYLHILRTDVYFTDTFYSNSWNRST